MSLSHQLLSLSSVKSHSSFKKNLKTPEVAQKKILEGLIKSGVIKDLDSFKSHPCVDYKHYKEDIEKARQNQSSPFLGCERFEPTSGSTETLKWIPYTKTFKAELDRAAGPWIRDLYKTYPGINKGPHYWSLSWLPDDLRKEVNNQDTNALPWYKSFLLNQLMVTDPSFEKLPTSRLFMMTSLLKILQKKASLVSVWSPTFFLRLLDLLLEEKDWLLENLRGESALSSPLKDMTELHPSALSELFSNLSLLSAWDSASSAFWAKKLQELFPHVPFQGKGLWATEGVVTIPFEGKHPLAINSHYYEFWCPEKESLVSLEDLSINRIVQPVLTTGSGFVRYHLKDNIKVTDFHGKTPCFEFLGRSRHVDLAGEKISFDEASTILKRIGGTYKVIEPLCLIAHETADERRYKVLLQKSDDHVNLEGLAQSLEKELLENYHYKLARDLGQLGPAEVLIREDALGFYYESCGQRIAGAGNIKPEPLIHLKED